RRGFVYYQQSHEERKIEHGYDEEASRRDEVAQPCKQHAANEKADTGKYRPCQVEKSSESCGDRQQRDEKQWQNTGAFLPARASRGGIDDGEHGAHRTR